MSRKKELYFRVVSAPISDIVLDQLELRLPQKEIKGQDRRIEGMVVTIVPQDKLIHILNATQRRLDAQTKAVVSDVYRRFPELRTMSSKKLVD